MSWLICVLENERYWVEFKTFDELGLVDLIEQVKICFDRETKLRIFKLQSKLKGNEIKLIKKLVMTCTIVGRDFVMDN